MGGRKSAGVRPAHPAPPGSLAPAPVAKPHARRTGNTAAPRCDAHAARASPSRTGSEQHLLWLSRLKHVARWCQNLAAIGLSDSPERRAEKEASGATSWAVSSSSHAPPDGGPRPCFSDTSASLLAADSTVTFALTAGKTKRLTSCSALHFYPVASPRRHCPPYGDATPLLQSARQASPYRPDEPEKRRPTRVPLAAASCNDRPTP
jgi:hypothetical protein